MRVFKADSNNDIHFDDYGKLAIATGQDAVMQACEHAVKAQLGEMMYAADEGMPNFKVIWNGQPNIPQFIAALKRRIEGVTGVIQASDITASASNNVLTYSATIQTIYGEAYLNG